MAGIRKTELLVGTVDGVNKTFTTPGGEAYEAGSTVAFVAGLPRWSSNDDGYHETDQHAGEIEFKEAPLEGDDPALSWIPLADTLGDPIEGVLVVVESPPEVALEVTTPQVGVVVEPGDAVVEVETETVAVVTSTPSVVVTTCRM